MKAKRVIAVLLALMLIVGMLPLSAFAAENRYTIANTTVTLRSTKNFGSMTLKKLNTSTYQPEDKVVSDLTAYTSMGTLGEIITTKVTPDSTANVATYNKILADKAKNTTVEKGDTFYITVKITSDEANGIMPVNAIITYDGTAFTPGSKATVNALQRNGYLATNRVEITEEGSYKGKTFGSNMLDANLTAITENETGDSLLILPYTYNSNEYHTENPATEWDYVIPFTANEAVENAEFNIKVYQKGQTGSLGADGMKIMIPKSKITGDGSAKLSADTDLITFIGQDGYEGVKGDPTFVTVTSKDPAISIPASQVLNPVDDATIAVTLKNGTWNSTLAAADFEIHDGSGKVATATVNPARTSDTVATLTLNGTALAGKTGLKVVAKTTGFTATDDSYSGGDLDTGTTTFSVKDALSGTVTLTVDNGHTTANLVYGDTLTAAGTNATTPSYQWKIGGTAKTGATAKTYKPVAADVGKTITCVIKDSAANGKYGTGIESSDTSAVGKATLAVPAAGKFTGTNKVPAIKQGTTTLTVEGTYTFGNDEKVNNGDAVSVKYDATYTSSASNGNPTDVTVTFKGSLLGNQKDAYTFAGGTVSNVTGEVSESKYNLITAVSGGGTVPSVSYTGDNVTGTVVSKDGGTVTGTIANSALSGNVLNSVTLSNGTTATVTKKGENSDNAVFTFTLDPTTDVVDLTVTLNIGKGVTTVAFDDQNKDYDGDATFKGTITTKKPDGSDFALSDFGVTLAYSGADAGSTLTATGTQTTWTAANGDVYQLPTLTGTIGQATATTVKATAEGLKEGATADEIATAILGADVMVDNITVAQGKVSDYATKEDIIDELKKDDTIFKVGNKTVTEITDLTQSAADVTPAKIGDTIVITGVDVTEQLADVEGLTATFADNKTTIEVTGADIAETTIDLTPADDTDAITVKIAAATGLEQGTDDEWTITAGDITVTLANITASGKFATNFDNANFNLAVTASIGRKSSGSGIPYDTKGYAVAGMDEVEVDEENKITSLTEVTDIVKGAVFTGWSTDGTKDHIVKVGYQFKENELENGLTAVFEGYMMGDNKGKVNAEKSVTRAELLKMLLVSSGKFDATKNYDYSKTEGFKDVKKDSTAWYVPYLACNLELSEDQRVIKGFEDGTFHPDDKVTREQAAVMIARAFGVKTEGATTTKVTDIDKIPSWARESVAAMCENGTINGFPDGTFRGGVSTARCQAAHMVNPYLGLEAADEKTIRDDATVKNPFPDLSKNHWAYHDLMFASLSVKSDYYQTEITIPGAAPAAPETPAE